MLAKVRARLKRLTKSDLLTGVVFVAVFMATLLQSYQALLTPKFSTDFVSFALSGMAPVLEIGMPYVDYWGINPPGLLVMLGSWGLVFGGSLHSFHILWFLSLLLIGCLTWLIVRRVLELPLSLIVFGVWASIIYSSVVQSQFFPSEINGLLLVTLGVYLVLKTKVSLAAVFWSSLLFILAGQMKEVFAFSGLVLLPHFLVAMHQGWRSWLKFMAASILGVLVAFGILGGYLLATNSLSEYQAINAYKSQQFTLFETDKISFQTIMAGQHPVNRFFIANYSLLLLGLVSILSLILSLVSLGKISAAKKGVAVLHVSIPQRYLHYALVVCYYLGALIGYAIQNRYGNKYDMVIVLPTLLLIAVCLKTLVKTVAWQVGFRTKLKPKILAYSTLAMTGLLVLGLMAPSREIIESQLASLRSYSPQAHITLWQNAESDSVLAEERRIMSRTQPDDCITKVYGWDVGDAYYYAQRPSCSKYFLVNILPGDKSTEYAQEIINNPPASIIYHQGGADMDIAAFEAQVFNFPQVLAQCYQVDSDFEDIYWPRVTGAELQECLKVGLPTPPSAAL